jgi:hypothetical protein
MRHHQIEMKKIHKMTSRKWRRLKENHQSESTSRTGTLFFILTSNQRLKNQRNEAKMHLFIYTRCCAVRLIWKRKFILVSLSRQKPVNKLSCYIYFRFFSCLLFYLDPFIYTRMCSRAIKTRAREGDHFSKREINVTLSALDILYRNDISSKSLYFFSSQIYIILYTPHTLFCPLPRWLRQCRQA